jgi:hypothetical protein
MVSAMVKITYITHIVAAVCLIRGLILSGVGPGTSAM